MIQQYSKQKYTLLFTTDAQLQLSNLKEHNWNSSNQNVRDLFNRVVFPRIDNTLFQIVNEDNFEDYDTNRNNEIIEDFPDDIGSVIFKIYEHNDKPIIEIQRFLWTFKQTDWLKDVEENFNYKRKRQLYENIMRQISKIVKKHLNNI